MVSGPNKFQLKTVDSPDPLLHPACGHHHPSQSQIFAVIKFLVARQLLQNCIIQCGSVMVISANMYILEDIQFILSL